MNYDANLLDPHKIKNIFSRKISGNFDQLICFFCENGCEFVVGIFGSFTFIHLKNNPLFPLYTQQKKEVDDLINYLISKGCGKKMKNQDELKKLKSLVRKFLKETRCVPYRFVDCDPIVHDLIEQMTEAVKPKRSKNDSK